MSKPRGVKPRHKDCGGAIYFYLGRKKCSSCQMEGVPNDQIEIIEHNDPEPERRRTNPPSEIQNRYHTVGIAAVYSRKKSR